jgi:hypothetical protein
MIAFFRRRIAGVARRAHRGAVWRQYGATAGGRLSGALFPYSARQSNSNFVKYPDASTLCDDTRPGGDAVGRRPQMRPKNRRNPDSIAFLSAKVRR